MSKNQTLTEQPITKVQMPSHTPQQNPVPPQLQQQISLLNARINNANFAYSDLQKEMNNTFNALLSTIIALQKENSELKTKHAEKP